MSALRNQKYRGAAGTPGGPAPEIEKSGGTGTGKLAGPAVANRIIDNIEKVIVGKHNEIVLTLAAYCAGGHVLLEDVPGWPRPCWPAPSRAASVARSSAFNAPRPVARRHHRQLHFQSQDDRVRVPARSALRANRPGR